MINTSKEKNKYIKSQNKIHQAPKYNLAPKQKLPISTCIGNNSPFCDELPMGNHDSSSKGGGYRVDPLVLAKSAHKA